MTGPVGFQCRACGFTGVDLILSLGRLPLANQLLTAEDLTVAEPRYPLEVALCRACGLVQLTYSVPPEELFRDYPYFSSFSDTFVAHAAALTKRVLDERRLGPGCLVVEVASNDGCLLQNYVRAGVPVLGIEPALNVARVARERGIDTVSEFFGEALAGRLAEDGRQADVIHANNVLAHVPDLPGFVRGVARLLKDTGVAIVEVPYVKDLVDRCEFDTIYHEHLSYFSVTAIDRLFGAAGLVLQHVERVPIHGGSLRLFAGLRAGAGGRESVERLLAEEDTWGAARLATYQRFAEGVERLRQSLVEMTGALKREERRIAAYGAAAKGSTLLNFARLGAETLDFVVDRSPHKQGRYMAGVRLPIYPTEKLLEAQPDYVLLLTWNFADEILAQQAEYRRRGGRFIVPVPEARIL